MKYFYPALRVTVKLNWRVSLNSKFLCRPMLLLALLVPLFANAEDLTDEKKGLIDDLLRVTGAANLGEMMAATFVGQMTNALKSSPPDLDPKAYDIIAEEVNQLIHEEVSGRNVLNDMMYPIYHRHLLTSDIKELIRFYQTPVG